MAISGLTDLLAFTEGSELTTGGDFTGSNGDPVNAWWNDNGGSAGSNQEIQSNKCELSNTNADGSSYIGRSSLGKNYLGGDGAQVPLVAQFDFTLTVNPTTAEAWNTSLQLYESGDDSFQSQIGHQDTLAAPGDWDTYGYGLLANLNGTLHDPNLGDGIINTSATSGKLRAELVSYLGRTDTTYRVQGRAFYWNGSKWVIINKNNGIGPWGLSLGNTSIYAGLTNVTTLAQPTPVTIDNFSVKEITDHIWGKNDGRIDGGFAFDFGNSNIVCEDQGTGTPHIFTNSIYTDGESYTTRITIDDYVNGECKVYHGATLLDTLTADGSYVLTGLCDIDGGNNYTELWLTSSLATNDFTVTSLTTEPTGLASGPVSVGGGLGFGQGWL
jgi:hypothetical protein